MGKGSKGLRHIEDFCASSQSGTSRKKIIYTKKVYETDYAEILLWISSIYFIINFNKAGKFLCFRRKATFNTDFNSLIGLIKKMFLGEGR